MIPKKIQAGMTAKWSMPLYSEFADHTFEYIFQGVSKIDIPTTVSGIDIVVNVVPEVTEKWIAGDYHYQLIATKGTDKQLVESGTITIEPDFLNLPAGHDFRTHAEKMLDVIKQVLEGRIPKDIESYQIDGRNVQRIPILELHKLKRTYAFQVNKEKRRQAGKSAFKPRTVKARFKT